MLTDVRYSDTADLHSERGAVTPSLDEVLRRTKQMATDAMCAAGYAQRSMLSARREADGRL